MTVSFARTPLSFNTDQLRTFKDRYALRSKDDPANLLEDSPKEMWSRVARWAAQNEKDSAKWSDQFYEALSHFKFIPGGRIMHAAGSGATVTASNCYVLPSPEDSRKGILHTLGQVVETEAWGGGVGLTVSTLRPSGEVVKGVHGTSSGPLPWMELFSTATHKVVQQGGSRRGALMLMMHDYHPDIFSFVNAKRTPGVLEGANLSVLLSDDFMRAVREGGEWELKWGGKVYQTIEARELWDAITSSAWASGEPGCFWVDQYNKQRNIYYREDQEVNCTNPCGEQPLPPYGVCLLGTINASAFVNSSDLLWDELRQTVWRAVRFLDNVIDLCQYPLPEFAEHQQNVRRMGLGVTGLADALIKLKIQYGEKAVPFVEKLYSTIAEEAWRESIRLAEEKGPFPYCEPELHADSWMAKKMPNDLRERIRTYGIRNGYLTSQQPSGTGSLLAGVNSGIEPVFDFDMYRKDRLGTRKITTEAVRLFVTASSGNGSVLPSEFVSAGEVPPEGHVLVQAAAQRWNDSAISKTVNAPSTFTIEDTKKLYEFAYEQGLRTIAFYRDGSRDAQVLYKGSVEADEKPEPVRKKLPSERQSITHRFAVGEQEGYVTVGLYEDGTPGEMFVTMSKEGSTTRGLMDAFATSISINLQYGVTPEYLVKKFSGSKFEPAGLTGNPEVAIASSIIDYIFRWFGARFVEQAEEPVEVVQRNGHLCPFCGGMLAHQEGCEHCESCDYMKCG